MSSGFGRAKVRSWLVLSNHPGKNIAASRRRELLIRRERHGARRAAPHVSRWLPASPSREQRDGARPVAGLPKPPANQTTTQK